jgi:sulfate permease, SulP family
VSVALLFVFKFVWPRVPGPLIVMVGGILLVAFTGLADAGVDLITPVSAGLPLPSLPSIEHTGALLPGAFAIAIMAFLESAAVARGIRKAGEKQIDSNQELLATSIASVAGSFFQTMPAAGGFAQSAVNQGAGAKSQASTLVTVALAVLTALFLGPILSLLPQATLAAMVFVAVLGLIDLRGLVRYFRASKPDFWTALATAVAGLTAGLVVAVAVGVIITLGLVLHELNKVRVTKGVQRRGVLEVNIGPLYTANVLESELAVIALVEESEGVNAIVLDLQRMVITSVTVLDALEDLERELGELGVELRLAGMPATAQEVALRTSWFQGLVADQRVFSTVDDAFDGPLK